MRYERHLHPTAVVLALLGACCGTVAVRPTYAPGTTHPPSAWGGTCNTGASQSPVNLGTADPYYDDVVEDGELPALRFRYYSSTVAAYTWANKWAMRLAPSNRNAVGFAPSKDHDTTFSTLMQINIRSPAEHVL